jgi:hypothetical protein
MAQPLPELKRVLSAQIQEAIRRIEAQIPPPGWNQALPLVITNVRLGFTALGLAVGFAATGRRRGHSSSLLEEAGMLLEERRGIRQERQRSRQAFLRSVEEAQLEHALQAEEETRLRTDSDTSDQPTAPAEIDETGQQNRRRGVDLDYFDLLSQQEQDEEQKRQP